VIISHDRHFLNEVCTHMADMDFGTLKVYPGNYDSYMLASVQARTQQLSSNVKAKEKIAELQAFVARFSANASKARQATSRQRQLEKIEIVEVKPSSRQNPFIRFDTEKKLHNMAVECNGLTKTYDRTIFKNFKLGVRAGEKIAIIGQNGAGKTTLLNSILSKRFDGIAVDSGDVKWAENAKVGVMPQDNTEMFSKDELLMDWMNWWRNTGDDDQSIRGTLGRLLFSGDDIGKSVKVLSGGEKGRMIWGKLMLQKYNVLAMDEPTNHMDMESIESLQIALEKFDGTLLFVSHDREFVSSLANRILEVKMDGTVVDYSGTYEEYLRSQAITG
jgi:ATPase subunit of ABC transporter with duplicated ATPase domains